MLPEASRLTEEQNGHGTDRRSSQELSFMSHLSEAADGIDLTAVLKGRYEEDDFFTRILAEPRQFKNFRVI